ncbi:alpha/beta hydrolase [Desulforamulus ruminis]|uniref:alpha/beta fold hydrolase n=1 Tax=Desulforamulus ruminis TaxID=1564 RepID=UPI002FDA756B
MTKNKSRGIVKTILMVIGVLLCAIIVVAAGYIINNLNYFHWDRNKVTKAGFQEKQFTIGDTILNYAEGPSNGPALLLIHGQIGNWENYAKVLPELSKHYHVYVVDCHGHGKSSKNPEKYNVESMGKDFIQFITQIIKKPTVVSGHSSGGLLAAWLAANSPENVVGVVLEDPPFFSSELPRYKETFAYVDMSLTCHHFLQQGVEDDFTRYYIKNCYWIKFFQDGQKVITNYALSYREKHPHAPLKIFFFPPSMNEPFRTMDLYDPYFGDTFYDGSWHKNFDHAEALSKITCPSVLIHTNWSYDKHGILLAAMDEKDADRAHSLLKNDALINVKSGHGFHFEKPKDFIKIMIDFKDRI